MAKIDLGDPAPDFSRPSHDGQRVTLGAYRGKRPVVLFFYPKDHTPVCTKEACGFRDNYGAFIEAGAALIGISGDAEDSHRRFAADQSLPYPLLSDTDGSLRALFGVPKTLGIFPGRVTYVIDREGIVRHIVNAPLSAARHIDEALAAVRQLSAQP